MSCATAGCTGEALYFLCGPSVSQRHSGFLPAFFCLRHFFLSSAFLACSALHCFFPSCFAVTFSLSLSVANSYSLLFLRSIWFSLLLICPFYLLLVLFDCFYLCCFLWLFSFNLPCFSLSAAFSLAVSISFLPHSCPPARQFLRQERNSPFTIFSHLYAMLLIFFAIRAVRCRFKIQIFLE